MPLFSIKVFWRGPRCPDPMLDQRGADKSPPSPSDKAGFRQSAPLYPPIPPIMTSFSRRPMQVFFPRFIAHSSPHLHSGLLFLSRPLAGYTEPVEVFINNTIYVIINHERILPFGKLHTIILGAGRVKGTLPFGKLKGVLNTMKKGKLFIISGPSGVGEGTVIDGILVDRELGLHECQTVTSRHPRGGKSDAQYHFVTADQFEKAINAKEMLEYNLYDGNYYGTSKKILYELLEAGQNAILEVDINGGIAVKSQVPTAKTIFVYAEISDIEKRIRDREENTEEEIQDRLTTARSELAMKDRYDYQVENPQGHPEEAIEKVKNIIRKNTI